MRTGVVGLLWSLMMAIAAPAAAGDTSATLELVGGGSQPLDAYRGRLLVLNFWATWCAPCRQELAELDSYVAAHPGEVAAVAVLAERRPEPRLVAARVSQLRMPIALRLSGAAGRYPLVNNAVPTTYVLDADGRISLRRAGAFPPGTMSTALDTLIARSR